MESTTPFASTKRRVAARLIDYIILAIFMYALIKLMISLGSALSPPQFENSTLEILFFFIVNLLLMVVLPASFFTCVTFFLGDTIGKKILGIGLVSKSGESLKLGRIFVRESAMMLLPFAGMILGGLLFSAYMHVIDMDMMYHYGQMFSSLIFCSIYVALIVSIARHPEHAGFHDRIIGSRVIHMDKTLNTELRAEP